MADTTPQTPGLLPQFYEVDSASVPGEMGTIINLEAIAAPSNAEAWRVIYRSQTAAGVTVPVSGIIVAPSNVEVGENLPILSWAHGTVGVARYCAPSNVPNPATDFVGYPSFESDVPNDYGIPGLSRFLDAGYVVAATDYQGLGAGQQHEYIIALTQARNALDIIRAARAVVPNAGDKAAVLGWSQGGLTALIAGEIADYTPEVDLVGVASMAPANPASFLIPEISRQSIGGPVIGRSILLARSYSWAYEDLKLTDMLSDVGIKAAKASERQCIQQLSTTGETAGGSHALMRLSNPNVDAWVDRFIENAPGQRVSLAPVLVMQGTADATIPPASTDLYMIAACQFSAPILRINYEGKDHRPLVTAAEDDFFTWIHGRFSGAKAQSSCPQHDPG
ncbi:alpha/beta fold hydrolase [Thalassorhabdomicrobium marinisediminis]|uniref:alpha/beta fold hydrolase n=1 Tax=Thalassorhabdomicrobium marinisediminis TaxID=2170577 RepID=UPI00248F941B|nr:alpha/beta fold hydrolase [Thalassorhabdomicrobium marinisediminis]